MSKYFSLYKKLIFKFTSKGKVALTFFSTPGGKIVEKWQIVLLEKLLALWKLQNINITT